MKPTETPPQMTDAIVDEVRAIRAEICAQFGDDVGKLCEYLRQMEAQYGVRVVQRDGPPGKSRPHIGSGTQG